MMHPRSPGFRPNRWHDDLIFVIRSIEEGRPFALSRFGDGELALATGRRCDVSKARENWNSPASEEFQAAIMESLQCRSPGYLVGVPCGTCGNCNPADKANMFDARGHDAPNYTFANLFVNGNWPAWFLWSQKHLGPGNRTLVGCGRTADILSPQNAVNLPLSAWILPTVETLVAQSDGKNRSPILVAAGPASCVLIHRYWLSCYPSKRRPIVDIGSSWDSAEHGIETRTYHLLVSGMMTECQWESEELCRSTFLTEPA